MSKGSIGPAFAVCIRTENQDQASFCPFALREVSVLAELALGHLRYSLTDVPPQSNSPPDNVLGSNRTSHGGLDAWHSKGDYKSRFSPHRVSKETMKVVVFQGRQSLPLILHLSCLFTLPD